MEKKMETTIMGYYRIRTTTGTHSFIPGQPKARMKPLQGAIGMQKKLETRGPRGICWVPLKEI